MIIGHITFKFTHGAVVGGNVSFNPRTAKAHLPKVLAETVKVARDDDCAPEVAMTADGVKYQLAQEGEDLYRATVVGAEGYRSYVSRIIDSFIRPAHDQRQQLGRTLHASALACIVGAVGLAHGDRFDFTGPNMPFVAVLALTTLIVLIAGNFMMEDPRCSS